MRYELLKEENTVVAYENDVKTFAAKIIVDGDIAWLDSMYFSEEKKAELNTNESFLKGSFDYMGIMLDGIKEMLKENGYEINHVTLGDFEDIKMYNKFAAMTAEEIMLSATKSTKRA